MAAALRARALGHAVTLVERNPALGGRAAGAAREGFRFDLGPTVLTAPHLVEELFALFGVRMAERLPLRPVDPFYAYHFPDGSRFRYRQGREALLAEIEAFAPQDRAGYLRLAEAAEGIFRLAFERLADVPFHDPRLLLRYGPALLRHRAFLSVHGLVARHLKDDRLRRAFSSAPLLVGGHPFHTTSIYLLIHALEQRWGVYYPAGGIGGMVAALERLMEEAGIEIIRNVTVEGLEAAKTGRLTAVRLAGGQRIGADRFISNADPAHLYRHVLPGRRRWTPRRLRRLSYSPGLFLLYLGVRGSYAGLDQHNILFGNEYRRPLDEIFYKGRIPEDFSLYLHRASAGDPGMAPEGCESLYALVPVPNLLAPIDWAEAGPRLCERVLERLESTLLPGLRGRIIHSHFVTPRDFEGRFLAQWGSGFSIAPLFTQSAWFRFHNRSEEAPNLYLAGAGTHPGAGIPGVLCSAKVVERLLRDS